MDRTEVETFTKYIRKLIADQKWDETLEELDKASNLNIVKDSGLDLIPEIVTCAYDPNCAAGTFCRNAFQKLANMGNPKELLMGFMEQLELSESADIWFQFLLSPMQILLERLPAKREQSLQWVLDALQGKFKTLPIPKLEELEEGDDGRLLLDSDEKAINICRAIEAVNEFLEPFIINVSLYSPLQEYRGSAAWHERKMISNLILHFFDAPLAYVNLAQDNGGLANVATRHWAERLVSNLSELESDFYRVFASINSGISDDLLQNHENRRESSTLLSLATFSYLLHAEGMQRHHLPCVYSHRYIFELNLPLICCLLMQSHECVIQKGLLLVESLMQFIDHGELGTDFLDFDGSTKLAVRLIHLMLHCGIVEFRRMTVCILMNLLDRFSDDGRYQLLLRLLKFANHSGVKSLLVQKLKDYIVIALQKSPPTDCFVGQHLHKILRIVLTLPQGVNTDLLMENESILAALNLVRYLVIRDMENVSGIWDLTDSVQETYLKPLQSAIDLSRVQAEVELRKVTEEIGTDDKGAEAKKEEIDIVATVEGETLPLPNLSKEEQINAVKSAITGLDLIQSVLAIVNDNISARKPN